MIIDSISPSISPYVICYIAQFPVVIDTRLSTYAVVDYAPTPDANQLQRNVSSGKIHVMRAKHVIIANRERKMGKQNLYSRVTMWQHRQLVPEDENRQVTYEGTEQRAWEEVKRECLGDSAAKKTRLIGALQLTRGKFRCLILYITTILYMLSGSML